MDKNSSLKLSFTALGKKLKANDPTVVFNSALGLPALYWEKIQREVSFFTRTIRYDRSGYGFSESRPKEQRVTSQLIAKELNYLLDNSGEQGPYILVGHSFGGFNVRAFANMFPEKVHSLVLVDASEESFIKKLYKDPPKEPSEESCLDSFLKKYGDSFSKENLEIFKQQIVSEKANTAALKEMQGILESAEQMLETHKNLREIPTVIISRGLEEQKSEWMQAQKRLVNLFKHSKHIIAHKSDHMIPLMEPKVVVNAIFTHKVPGTL